MRRNWGETAMGFLVLVLGVVFVIYAVHVVGGGGGSGSYDLSAKVGDAGGLEPGAKVTIGGVKVGSVESVTIDPKSYLAVNSDIQLPSDSTAKITSDGLLGGAHVAIAPGGAEDNLKPGDEFSNTQGSVDLMGLIGQFIRPHGDSAPASASSPSSPAASSATAPAAHTPVAKGAGALPDM